MADANMLEPIAETDEEALGKLYVAVVVNSWPMEMSPPPEVCLMRPVRYEELEPLDQLFTTAGDICLYWSVAEKLAGCRDVPGAASEARAEAARRGLRFLGALEFPWPPALTREAMVRLWLAQEFEKFDLWAPLPRKEDVQ